MWSYALTAMRKFLILGSLLVALQAGAQPAPAPNIGEYIQSRLDAFFAKWPGSWTVAAATDGSIASISGRPAKLPGPPDFDVRAMRDMLAELHGTPTPQFDEHPQVQKLGAN